MEKETTEKAFKQISQYAEWVPIAAANDANEYYGEIVRSRAEDIRAGRKYPFDEINLHAIEALLNHPIFKDLWAIHANLHKMFLDIFFDHQAGRRTLSDIQVKKKIDSHVSHLKSIISDIKNDSTLRMRYVSSLMQAACETISTEVKSALGDEIRFFEVLCRELSTPSQSNSFYRYPRKGEDAERIHFILRVSYLVKETYDKPKHKLTADILNVIRPDLGGFDANGISKAVNRKK